MNDKDLNYLLIHRFGVSVRKLYRLFIPFLVCFIYLLPTVAHADLLGFWLRPKVDYVSGTGDIFQRFAGQPAYGGELGLELLGITVWADAELMTEDQYWMSGNVGYDLSFGSDIKLTLGVYGGFIAFKFLRGRHIVIKNPILTSHCYPETCVFFQTIDRLKSIF